MADGIAACCQGARVECRPAFCLVTRPVALEKAETQVVSSSLADEIGWPGDRLGLEFNFMPGIGRVTS